VGPTYAAAVSTRGQLFAEVGTPDDAGGSTPSIAQFTIEPTGLLTALTPPSVIGYGLGDYGLVLNPTGNFLYTISGGQLLQNGGSAAQYASGTAGALTALTPASVTLGMTGSRAGGIAVDGTSVYAGSSSTQDGGTAFAVAQLTAGGDG